LTTLLILQAKYVNLEIDSVPVSLA